MYIQHNLEFHHLSKVLSKQLCALAHLESTRAAVSAATVATAAAAASSAAAACHCCQNRCIFGRGEAKIRIYNTI